jgi:type II secretory pathway pseudopilin PulG
MKFFKNKKSGFTLIEALVAVSILMIAIASPMYLTQKSLSTASLAKDQMVASFLAQDAIEAVKNIRDEISLRGEGEDWLEGTLLQPCLCNDKDVECNFDYPDKKFITFCTIDTTALSWNEDFIKVGFTASPGIKLTFEKDIEGNKVFLKYDYNTKNFSSCKNFTGPGYCSEDSKYSRYINILKNPTGNNPDEALLKVRVSWDTPLGPQNVEIENFLYNFSENF